MATTRALSNFPRWSSVESDPEFGNLTPADKDITFTNWKNSLTEVAKEDPTFDSNYLRELKALELEKRAEYSNDPLASKIKETSYDLVDKGSMDRQKKFISIGETNPEMAEVLKGDKESATIDGHFFASPSVLLDRKKFREQLDKSGISEDEKLNALAEHSQLREQAGAALISPIRQADEVLSDSVWGGLTKFTTFEDVEKQKNENATDADIMEAWQKKNSSWYSNIGTQVKLGAFQGATGLINSYYGVKALTGIGDQEDTMAMLGGVQQVQQQLSGATESVGGATAVATGTAIATEMLPMFVVGPAARLPVILASAAPRTALALTGRLGAATAARQMSAEAVAEMAKKYAKAELISGMAGSAITAGLQSAGGTFKGYYDTFLEQETANLDENAPDYQEQLAAAKDDAKRAASFNSFRAGAVTAALTALGGATGNEAFARGGLTKAGAREALEQGLTPYFWKTVAKEAMSEGLLEEGPDALINGILDKVMVDPNKSIQSIVDDTISSLAWGGLFGGGFASIKATSDILEARKIARDNPQIQALIDSSRKLKDANAPASAQALRAKAKEQEDVLTAEELRKREEAANAEAEDLLNPLPPAPVLTPEEQAAADEAFASVTPESPVPTPGTGPLTGTPVPDEEAAPAPQLPTEDQLVAIPEGQTYTDPTGDVWTRRNNSSGEPLLVRTGEGGAQLRLSPKDFLAMAGRSAPAATATATAPEAAPAAGVPMMVTRDMKQQLYDRGYSKAQVFSMTPQEAQDILNPAATASTEPTVETPQGGIPVAGAKPLKKKASLPVEALTPEQATLKEKLVGLTSLAENTNMAAYVRSGSVDNLNRLQEDAAALGTTVEQLIGKSIPVVPQWAPPTPISARAPAAAPVAAAPTPTPVAAAPAPATPKPILPPPPTTQDASPKTKKPAAGSVPVVEGKPADQQTAGKTQVGTPPRSRQGIPSKVKEVAPPVKGKTPVEPPAPEKIKKLKGKKAAALKPKKITPQDATIQELSEIMLGDGPEGGVVPSVLTIRDTLHTNGVTLSNGDPALFEFQEQIQAKFNERYPAEDGKPDDTRYGIKSDTNKSLNEATEDKTAFEKFKSAPARLGETLARIKEKWEKQKRKTAKDQGSYPVKKVVYDVNYGGLPSISRPEIKAAEDRAIKEDLGIGMGKTWGRYAAESLRLLAKIASLGADVTSLKGDLKVKGVSETFKEAVNQRITALNKLKNLYIRLNKGTNSPYLSQILPVGNEVTKKELSVFSSQTDFSSPVSLSHAIRRIPAEPAQAVYRVLNANDGALKEGKTLNWSSQHVTTNLKEARDWAAETGGQLIKIETSELRKINGLLVIPGSQFEVVKTVKGVVVLQQLAAKRGHQYAGFFTNDPDTTAKQLSAGYPVKVPDNIDLDTQVHPYITVDPETRMVIESYSPVIKSSVSIPGDYAAAHAMSDVKAKAAVSTLATIEFLETEYGKTYEALEFDLEAAIDANRKARPIKGANSVATQDEVDRLTEIMNQFRAAASAKLPPYMAKNYLEDKGLTTPVEGEEDIIARITGGKLATVIEGMYKNRGWRVASFLSFDTAPIELGVDNLLKYPLRNGESEGVLKQNLSRIVNDVVSKVDARIKHIQAEANMSLDSLSKFHSEGVLFGIDDLVEGPTGAAFLDTVTEALDNEPLSDSELKEFNGTFRSANNGVDNRPLRKELARNPALVRQANELYRKGVKFTFAENGLAFPMGAPLEADEVNDLIDILNISVDPSIGGESLSDQVRKFPALARAIVVIATDLRQSLSKAGVPQAKIDQMNVEQLINHHSSGGIKSPRIQALLRKATDNIDANLGAQVTKALSTSEGLRLMASQGAEFSALIRSTIEPSTQITPQNKYTMDNMRRSEDAAVVKVLEDTLAPLEEKLVTHQEAINSIGEEIKAAETVVNGFKAKSARRRKTAKTADPLNNAAYLEQVRHLGVLQNRQTNLILDRQRLEEAVRDTTDLINTKKKGLTGVEIPVADRIAAVKAVEKLVADNAKVTQQDIDSRYRSSWGASVILTSEERVTYGESPVTEDLNKDLLELTTQEDPDAPLAAASDEEVAQMKDEASILGLESGNPNSVRRLISNLANSSGAKVYPHLQGLAKMMLASEEIMGSITDVKIINDPAIAADGSFVDGVLTINYASITSNIVTTETAASFMGPPAPASDILDATNVVDTIIRSILAGHVQQLTDPGAQLTPRQAEALKELDSLRQEAIRAEKESRHFALAPRFMSELASVEAFVNALLTSPELASFLSTFKTKAVKPTLTSLWGRLWKAFASLLTGKDAAFGSSLHVSLMTTGRLLPFKAPKNAHLASDLMKFLRNPGLAMVQTRLATQTDIIVTRAVVDVREAITDPATEEGLDDRAENGPNEDNDPENIRGQETAMFPSGSPLVTSPAPTPATEVEPSVQAVSQKQTNLSSETAYAPLADIIGTVEATAAYYENNENSRPSIEDIITALDTLRKRIDELRSDPLTANKAELIGPLNDMVAMLEMDVDYTARYPVGKSAEESANAILEAEAEAAAAAAAAAKVATEEVKLPAPPTLTPAEENVVVKGYAPDLLDDLIDAALEGSGIPVSFVTEKDFPQAGESPMFVRTDGLDDRIFVNRAALRTQIISWRSENKGTIKDVNRLLKSMIDEEIDHLIVVSRFLNGDLLAVMDNLSRDDRRQVLADYFDIKNIGSADAAKAMGEHSSQTPEEQARARVAFAHEYLRMVKQRAATGYRTEDATKMGGQKLGLIARVGAYLRATTTRVITRWNAYGDPYALRAILHINDYSRAMGIKPHPEVSGILATIEPMAGGTPEEEEAAVVGARSIAPVTKQDFEFLELAKDPEKNQSLLQQIVDAVAVAAGYTPTRVYHGTKKRRFTVFDNSKGRTLDERDSVRSPIFFSENQGFAEDYANYRRPEGDKTPTKLYTVYLRVKNLWDYRNKANQEAAIKAFPDKATSIREGAWKFIESPPFQKWLLDQGHDGFVNNERFADNYAVYDPRQIKMAEAIIRDSKGNIIPPSKRFNTESPSILAARPIGPRKPTSAMEGVLPVFPERVRDLLKSETYVSRIETDDISYVEDNIGDLIKDAKDPQDFLSLAHSLTSVGFRFTPAQTSLARGLIIAAMNRNIDALEAAYTATPHPDTFLLKEQYEDASSYLTGVVMDQRSETGTLFQSFQQMDQILRPGTIARLYRKKMSARTESELDKQPKAKKAAREILKGVKQVRSSAGKEAVSKSPLIKKVVGSLMKKLNLPESAGQTQFDFMSEMETLIGQMNDSPDDLRFRRNEIVSSVAKKMVERFVTPLLKTSPDTPPSVIEQVRAEVTKIVSFKINEALEGDTSSTAKVRPDSVTRLFERMGVASAFNNPYNVATLSEQAFNEAKIRILSGLVIPEGATQAQADEITRTYRAATDMSFDAVSAKSINEVIRNAFKMREQMILNAEQQSLSIASLTSMVLEMGDLTQAQAAAVATALKATYDRQVAEASEKFLKNYVASVEGSKSPEAVRLSQNERLLKLIYLGGFSTEEFYSAVADEFKIPTYDPEVAKSLEAEGRRVYNLPQGSVQRLDAVRDLNARLAKEYIDGMFKQLGKKALLKDREVLLTYLLDLPASAWKAGNLSGLGTSEINFVMGNLQAALDLGLNAVGYGIAAKDPGLLVQNFGTLVKAIFWPFDKNARAETWSEMKRAAFTGRTRFMSEQSESVLIMEQKIPITPILRPGVALWRAIGRVIQVIDAAVSVPVNLARQRLVMSYAMQQEGMRGSEIREVLRNSFSPDELVMREIEDQLNQEQSQFDTSRRPDLMREARKFQLLEERRQEIAEAHGSYEDLIEAGRESARKANLSDIPSGLSGVVFNSLSRLEGRTRGATAPVTAFANSMGNLFDLGLGIGVPGLSPILSIARAFNRSPSTFILPDNSKYRRKHVEYGSPDFYKLIAQSAFGLILQATIIPLFIKGLEDEDEDREPLFMVYGKGYSDPDKTRQLLLRQPRWKPNTIKLGDIYINWKDLPGLNMMFGGLASYTDYRLDTMAKDMSKVRTSDTALRVTLGAFKAVFAKNAMQGLQDALELIDDSSTATLTAPQKTVKWATNLASGITNPRILRDVSDMSRGLADPDGEYKLFDSRGYTAAMVSMLPANTLYADALGVQEMINARGAPVTNFWYAPATKRILPTSSDSGYDPIISPLVEAGLFLKPPTKDMAFKTYMNDSDVVDKKGATLGSFAPEVSTQAIKLYGDYMTRVLTANDGALLNRLVEMAKTGGVNGIEQAQKMLDKQSSNGKDIAQRPIQRAILDRELVPHWQE